LAAEGCNTGDVIHRRVHRASALGVDRLRAGPQTDRLLGLLETHLQSRRFGSQLIGSRFSYGGWVILAF